jgi:hypothetical protein
MTDEIDCPTITYDGAYWSGFHGTQRVHGEAWHLAAMISDRHLAVTRHEVLYVGRAYGTDGSRSVEDRAQAHSTIQRIYEDNQASDWDIFLTPLIVQSLQSTNDDHIDDDDEGPQGDLLWAILTGNRAITTPHTINTVEHLLIAYFRPSYNRKLLQWGPARHFDPLRESGFRLLNLQFQTLHELTAFFTQSRPPSRTHNIVAEVPRSKNATKLTIGTWHDINVASQSFPAILKAAAGTIAKRADFSPGILAVFGDSGPTLNPDFSAWP